MMPMKTLQCENGFTLIEALIAIAILTIGILGISGMQLSAIQGNHGAMILTEETNEASSRLEQMLSMPYDSDSNSIDDDGDGSIDEADEQFVDGGGTNNGSAGLDDGPLNSNTSDGSLVTSDGKYTIYWNVAAAYPQTGMKTIRVFVQNNAGAKKTVFFTHYKINF